MPELPDITIYIERLRDLLRDATLEKIRLVSPFLLRTAVPPVESVQGRKLLSISRIGKRMAFSFENDLHLILHLMIAGRLHWRKKDAAIPRSNGLAAFDFSSGSLILTESGSRKRASLHCVDSQEALNALDPGGLEVLECGYEDFKRVLLSENHTLKRSLTDPHLFSGIGNAYSDEILHHAGLSPVLLTSRMEERSVRCLYEAVKAVLTEWTDRLRRESQGAFPEKVTAFRPEMAVHGKYRNPCPVCGSPVQRIRYSQNETNYCPDCQTGGKLLADRALSTLLRKDWPRSLEELEQLRSKHKRR